MVGSEIENLILYLILASALAGLLMVQNRTEVCSFKRKFIGILLIVCSLVFFTIQMYVGVKIFSSMFKINIPRAFMLSVGVFLLSTCPQSTKTTSKLHSH